MIVKGLHEEWDRCEKCEEAEIGSFFHCSSSEKASFTKDLHLFEFNKCEIFWFLEIIPEKKLLTKVETKILFLNKKLSK